MLEQIRNFDTSIIITVGSLRDIAAAYLADTELFHAKIEKIVVFAGDFLDSYDEYNVSLDKEAYETIMNSGLPIYWIPCFQNGLWTSGKNTSYFQAYHHELLKDCPQDLLNWFIYEYYDLASDFMTFNATPSQIEIFNGEVRNLWCSNILPFIIGNINENEIIARYNIENNQHIDFPFYFTEYEYNGNTIQLFTIGNESDYVSFSKWFLNDMFSSCLP